MKVRSVQTWRSHFWRNVCSARRAQYATHARFYSAASDVPIPAQHDTSSTKLLTSEARKRIPDLVRAGFRDYPRIKTHQKLVSCKDFHVTYESLKKGGLVEDNIVTLHGTLHPHVPRNSLSVNYTISYNVPSDNNMVSGRLSAIRESGSKLVFLDIEQVVKVQGVCSLSKCLKENENKDDFKQFMRLLRRGDVIGMIPPRIQDISTSYSYFSLTLCPRHDGPSSPHSSGGIINLSHRTP